ncbi:DUF3761 domain-containing protein [Aquitalea aquatica]|uniref:DUF3761 domain-containing protein n=1 Tax=Aquitalea aquatica TaxID=3044273 RepID=A0A838Y0T1_9NEIS|nr:DUF3761 domain-containing protein [Aquitalea magnusonii]MBA4707508.1 DUF3761 domain-containing protein [Aquitalea magnusonii]
MKFIILALAAVLAMQPAMAKKPNYQSTEQIQEDDLMEHGGYTNSDGEQVHSPAHTKSGKKPNGASAKCRDGSYSFSQHHRGTCSGHGGVAQWYK